jgi:type VI secretion system protein VasG
VVLLDEVEKAHPDVLELFFQVFDKGVLDDGEGREINFRNTVIILTSNTGTEHIMQRCLNAGQQPTPDEIVEGLREELNQVFKPAFLGRLTIVPYYPVKDAILERIVALKLERIRQRFERNHQAVLSYDAALVKAIAARCTEVDSGARNIDNILSKTLMPELAQQVLERMAQDTPIQSLHIEMDSDGDFACRLS